MIGCMASIKQEKRDDEMTDTVISANETKRPQLADIIRNQFRLELLLKRKELCVIRERLYHTKRIAEDMCERLARSESFSDVITRKPRYSQEESSPSTPHPSRSYPTRTQSDKRHPSTQSYSNALYVKTEENQFVKMTCPKCERSDFIKLQGFVNHCILSHDVRAGSHEEAVRRFGIPVNEDEVPWDHPSRFMEPIRFNPLFVAMAAESDEYRNSANSSYQENEMKATELLDSRVKAVEMSTKPMIHEHGGIVNMDLDEQERSDLKYSSLEEENESLLEQTPFECEDENKTSDTTFPENRLHEHDNQLPSMSTHDLGIGTSEEIENNQSVLESPAPTEIIKNIDLRPESESLPMKNPIAGVSRFYITKKVIVGNVSRYIPPDQREDGNQFTHKWKVYVCGPAEDSNISHFVKKVRFFLHPSYKPNDVIEVNQAPFTLARWGWGEFPIRVQLHLRSSGKKTIDIIHQLLLDKSLTGSQVLGSERPYNVEVDRLIVEQTPEDETITTKDGMNRDDTRDPILMSQPQHPGISDQPESETKLDALLHSIVEDYPLVRKASSPEELMSLPYTCAISLKQYFDWSIGKRKAIEWLRARQLKKRLIHLDETTDLSTKQLLVWCRERGYTPQKFHNLSASLDSSLPATDTVTLSSCPSTAKIQHTNNNSLEDLIPAYCKYCGLQHQPRQDFDQLQKNCRYKPTLNTIANSISVKDLLAHLKPLNKNPDQLVIDLGEGIVNTESSISIESDLFREETSIMPNDPRLLEWTVNCLQRLHISLGVHDPKTVDRGIIVGNAIIASMKCFLKDLMKVAAEQANLIKPEDIQRLDSTDTKQSSSLNERMLTPLHVYRGIHSKDYFDFLTSKYMKS